MPTRRDCLAAGAGGLSGALAGCLTRLGLARTGELQLKAVSGVWTYHGRRYRDQVRFVARDGPRIVDEAFRVVDVHEGGGRDWRSEVTTFDFDALHADHGR